MGSDRSVSIIIPVYGPPRYLAACLVALIEADTPDHELILVDNGTGYVDPAAADQTIVNENNLGFAVACNQAADIAAGEILLFLNVDTEVRPGWLQPLIAAFDDPTVGMVGARLVYPNGNIQHAGIRFCITHQLLDARNIRTDEPSRDVEGVTGACLAIRREVFDQVGGFDDGYYNGFDDVDLCLKVRAAGWRIRYVAESTVMHHESVTGTKERSRAIKQNVERLQRWRDHPVVVNAS